MVAGRSITSVLVGGAALFAGCGLSITGITEGPGDGGALLAPDADAPVVAPVACGESACGLGIPAGWSIAVIATAGASCPASFGATDVVEDPVASDACECSCRVTETPSCLGTTRLPSKYDNQTEPLCNQSGSAISLLPSGRCETLNAIGVRHELFLAPTPTAAKCAATVAPNKALVQSTPVRICTPPSCADACQATPFKTCLVAKGDQACPADAPEKHLVGTDVNVTCPDCACRAATPDTCSGEWTLYSDPQCQNLKDRVPPNICTPTTTGDLRGYKWTPAPVNATCTPVPKPGTASLVGTSTVCCK